MQSLNLYMMLHEEESIIAHWNLHVKWLVEHHQFQDVVFCFFILVVVKRRVSLLD